MQEHGLIAFALSAVFDEAGATALDLNTTTGALLDVLHIGTALADDLGPQVESGDRFKIDGNAFLWPFALRDVSRLNLVFRFRQIIAYSTELIPLYLLGFSAPESPLVNEIRQLLLHEVVNYLDGLVEALLGCARHMEIERWVLQYD